MRVDQLIAALSEMPAYYDVSVEMYDDDGEWLLRLDAVELGTGEAIIAVRP